MKPEIEAKFLNTNHDALRAKLIEIGATRERPMRLMRRKVFDFPDFRLDKQKNAWVRVRDEGDKITMGYKQLNDRSLEGTHEVSVEVDDFDTACAFLESVGMEVKAYQETKRESWRLGAVEIELDEWPWIRPFAEIEGPDEASLRHVAARLGLDWRDVRHGSVEVAYLAEYDVTEHEIDMLAAITFETALPELLAGKRKKTQAGSVQ